MKLRKQTGAKAFLLAATLGLLAAIFGVVRSEPRIVAETSAPPSPAPGVNYDRFFGAQTGGSQPAPTPHTRTRAS